MCCNCEVVVGNLEDALFKFDCDAVVSVVRIGYDDEDEEMVAGITIAFVGTWSESSDALE